jgi:hypothetical protein
MALRNARIDKQKSFFPFRSDSNSISVALHFNAAFVLHSRGYGKKIRFEMIYASKRYQCRLPWLMTRIALNCFKFLAFQTFQKRWTHFIQDSEQVTAIKIPAQTCSWRHIASRVIVRSFLITFFTSGWLLPDNFCSGSFLIQLHQAVFFARYFDSLMRGRDAICKVKPK